MATVELRFAPMPEHVRTARLVATALARRAGVDESLLDEVRLAVGEACSRAVGLHAAAHSDAAVTVLLDDNQNRFSVEVADGLLVGETAVSAESKGAGHDGQPEEAAGGEGFEPWSETAGGDMGLAVISGLVDDLDIGAGEDGGVIRMSWPAGAEAAAPAAAAVDGARLP